MISAVYASNQDTVPQGNSMPVMINLGLVRFSGIAGTVLVLCFFSGTAENMTFANLMFDIKRLMTSSEIGLLFTWHSNIIIPKLYHHGQRLVKCVYTSPPHDETDTQIYDHLWSDTQCRTAIVFVRGVSAGLFHQVLQVPVNTDRFSAYLACLSFPPPRSTLLPKIPTFFLAEPSGPVERFSQRCFLSPTEVTSHSVELHVILNCW
jgi:hypothetical protein